MYRVKEVMNCFISIKTWLRRLYESKYAGHVPCGVRYKINYQINIHFKSALSVIHSLYINTNLTTILFISKRIVAWAVSGGGSLWVNAGSNLKWMPLWLQFSNIWHRRNREKRENPLGHPFCHTWSPRNIWWKPINVHRHLLLVDYHLSIWSSVGMVPQNLVSVLCLIAGQMCQLIHSLS